jgi:hypothetical protein
MPAKSDGQGSERRRNVVLRDLLDEMLQLTRHISNNAPSMTAGDLTYARERLEWLVDEVWEQATGTRKRDG